jgi:cytoskeletal protein CcmA (bactofilin family)
MMFKNGGTGHDDLNGFLDSGSHFHGELTFEASFRVDGKLTGKVRSAGSLVVGEGGEVDGDVKAAQIFVSGTLRGAVEATERLQIAPGGRVFAEITTPSLVIEDGAVFEGKCAMTGEGGGAAAPRAAEQPRRFGAAGAAGRATS